MERIRHFPEWNAQYFDIDGVTFEQIGRLGFRPSAPEICLPAPANLPLGDDQVSSSSASELTLRITRRPTARNRATREPRA